eukprot:1123522-Alexandrium_andersonii.AAC.1
MLAPAEANITAPPPQLRPPRGQGLNAPEHRVRARQQGLRPVDNAMEQVQDVIDRILYKQIRK